MVFDCSCCLKCSLGDAGSVFVGLSMHAQYSLEYWNTVHWLMCSLLQASHHLNSGNTSKYSQAEDPCTLQCV